MHTLIDNGLLPEVPNLEVPDFETTQSVIEELTTAEHEHQTLVFDALDGFEKLANASVCDADFDGNWGEKGFMGYQRGYRIMANGPWRGLLTSLDKLREARRMGIILLAHTGIGNFANPAGADYNRFLPAMHKDAWELTLGWADMVLFGYREIAVAKDKQDRKAKAHMDVEQRIMATEYQAVADAKNRHNLPPEINMGNSGREAWDNFMAALAAGRNNGKEE